MASRPRSWWRRMSIAEWVRQALVLVQARRSEPSREVAAKLEAIRAAARMDIPTADIDRLLEEIERGHGYEGSPFLLSREQSLSDHSSLHRLHRR